MIGGFGLGEGIEERPALLNAVTVRNPFLVNFSEGFVNMWQFLLRTTAISFSHRKICLVINGFRS